MLNATHVTHKLIRFAYFVNQR